MYVSFPPLVASTVGAAPSGLFAEVQHRVPMMSLDNAFDEAELMAWAERLRRQDADLDLGACGLAVDRLHQRQEAVCGPASDQLQLAGLEEAPEAAQQVVAVLVDKHLARPVEAGVIHQGQVVELRLPACAFDLLAGPRRIGDSILVPDDGNSKPFASLQEIFGEGRVSAADKIKKVK